MLEAESRKRNNCDQCKSQVVYTADPNTGGRHCLQSCCEELDMATDVRQGLVGAIREHGRSMVDDARRCEGILRDVCLGNKRELNLLLVALRAGVPAMVLNERSVDNQTLARLSRNLEDDYGLAEAAASWAVAAWVDALATQPGVGLAGLELAHSERAISAIPVSQPLPKSSPARPEIVVCQHGTGDFESLVEAVKAAPKRAVIRIRPGEHIGGLVIDRHLDLIGEGAHGEVVLVNAGAPCVTWSTDVGRIENLTFLQRTKASGPPIPAVLVSRGRPLFHACSFSSVAGAGFIALGPLANPQVVNCLVHGCGECGLAFMNGACGAVLECRVSDNGFAGIEVSEGSAPTVTSTEFVQGLDCGAHIYNGGRGTFKYCRFEKNATNGIVVREAGFGTFENCHIVGNRMNGVCITSKSAPVFLQSVIATNAGDAVLVDAADGEFSSCNLNGNTGNGVCINAGGNPQFLNCEITKNEGYGLLLADATSSIRDFEKSRWKGNKGVEWIHKAGAKTTWADS